MVHFIYFILLSILTKYKILDCYWILTICRKYGDKVYGCKHVLRATVTRDSLINKGIMFRIQLYYFRISISALQHINPNLNFCKTMHRSKFFPLLCTVEVIQCCMLVTMASANPYRLPLSVTLVQWVNNLVRLVLIAAYVLGGFRKGSFS